MRSANTRRTPSSHLGARGNASHRVASPTSGCSDVTTGACSAQDLKNYGATVRSDLSAHVAVHGVDGRAWPSWSAISRAVRPAASRTLAVVLRRTWLLAQPKPAVSKASTGGGGRWRPRCSTVREPRGGAPSTPSQAGRRRAAGMIPPTRCRGGLLGAEVPPAAESLPANQGVAAGGSAAPALIGTAVPESLGCTPGAIASAVSVLCCAACLKLPGRRLPRRWIRWESRRA
jgi:hypothetical protein